LTLSQHKCVDLVIFQSRFCDAATVGVMRRVVLRRSATAP
jgi:hypothetical protein